MKNFRVLMVVLSLVLSAGAHANAADEARSATAAAGKTAILANVDKPVAKEFSFYKADVATYGALNRASPVPEPDGWAMMLMGLGFVIYQVRRRKQSRKSWDLR